MKTYFVTGVSRGLGREVRLALLKNRQEGDELVLLSRRPVAEHAAVGSGVRYVTVDLADPDIASAVPKPDPRSSHVIFISNAGTIEPIRPAIHLTTQDLEYAIRVNALGPLELARRLAVECRQLGAKLRILNVSSGAAKNAIAGWSTYCVSKICSKMALDVLALENDHVEVLHFDPGVMDTDMQRCIRSQSADDMPDVEAFRAFSSSQRLRAARDVADDVLTLVNRWCS